MLSPLAFHLCTNNEYIGRMIGIIRGISKFPTYRRKFRQVVKALIVYNMEKESVTRPSSLPSVAGIENV